MPDNMKPIEFHVLMALSEQPLHGYALAQRIEADSAGRMKILPGNLYAILRRLEVEGLLRASPRRPGANEDQRRRYFELTPAGRKQLITEAKHLARLVRAVEVRAGKALGESGR